MIVLDTNVVSELASTDCDEVVASWVDGFAPEDLWITSTTVSEIVEGLMMMPEGRRQNELDAHNRRILAAFYDKTLTFSANAAVDYGRFVPDRFGNGKPINRADAQIAACCLAHGAALATRNTKDFKEIPGLEVIDPWQAAS